MSTNASYKNLEVYKKSKFMTIELFKLFRTNTSFRSNPISNQLLRSASSIGANIAEGYGRYYKKSYRQFLAIARGSSFETDYWLEVVLELQIFSKDKLERIIAINIEISKMLTAMMKGLEAQVRT